MTLAELISRYRTDAHDKAQPYFASDADVTNWLNDAEAEAVIRARLIHERDNPAVCQIEITVGQATYPLHAALYELTHVGFIKPQDDSRRTLRIVSPEFLDQYCTDWRDRVDAPEYVLQDDKTIRLVPTPGVGGTLFLEGYRLPLEPMALANKDTATPEIAPPHHRHLIQWALHRGFSIPDSEVFDPKRAAIAEAEFTRYFGVRPDSDMRRVTREDVPQHVEAFWP